MQGFNGEQWLRIKRHMRGLIFEEAIVDKTLPYKLKGIASGRDKLAPTPIASDLLYEAMKWTVGFDADEARRRLFGYQAAESEATEAEPLKLAAPREEAPRRSPAKKGAQHADQA